MDTVKGASGHTAVRSRALPGHSRLKNIIIAKLVGWFPPLGRTLAAGYQPAVGSAEIPWQPLGKPLSVCKVAVVTTAGIHHGFQPPFDMTDADGDPSFRQLNAATLWDDFTITHDYYDHSDAERDPNIVLPLDRLREFEQEGLIGCLATTHYGFMGHVTGRHLAELVEKSAVEVANLLKKDQVDLVLLSPA
ncbi:MAG: glycine/sarcosine/betaine reductase selenoprotein B family protein [Desulfuromonadales bacterium]|nr:glycine/sarcosine/betaine reductase selenoprotein B family protein [Desulfuromonadales bacterium]